MPKNLNFIIRGQVDLIMDEIMEELPLFTSKIFERYCRNWLLDQNSKKLFPFLLTDVGAWWWKNPLIKNSKANEEEVDIIGLGRKKNELLIGECKWRKEKQIYLF